MLFQENESGMIVVILARMPESSHMDVINSYHPWHWISASLPKRRLLGCRVISRKRKWGIVVILAGMPESSHTDVINHYHPWHWISASLPKRR
ncbi:MAG: hypothetical protein WCK96_14860 [Methylococcales bacterium]